MSLYLEYLTERTSDSIIETALGFVTYRYLNETQVYIVDIYVRPEFRKAGVCSALADQVVKEAKVKGRAELIGTVQPSAKNSTASLKVLLGYGMILQSASQDCIIFKKDI